MRCTSRCRTKSRLVSSDLIPREHFFSYCEFHWWCNCSVITEDKCILIGEKKSEINRDGCRVGGAMCHFANMQSTLITICFQFDCITHEYWWIIVFRLFPIFYYHAKVRFEMNDHLDVPLRSSFVCFCGQQKIVFIQMFECAADVNVTDKNHCIFWPPKINPLLSSMRHFRCVTVWIPNFFFFRLFVCFFRSKHSFRRQINKNKISSFLRNK